MLFSMLPNVASPELIVVIVVVESVSSHRIVFVVSDGILIQIGLPRSISGNKRKADEDKDGNNADENGPK